MARQPNILLITTDQHRYDGLAMHGNPLLRTPHLDALARDGVDFSRAFVQNTVCVPSRACLQTGRYTHQHGVTYMETAVDETPGLPPWEITFMERLQKAGYRTGATGKIHMYPEKGFDWHRLTGGKGARWVQATGQDIGPAPLGPTYAAWLEAKRPGAYEAIYAARRAQPLYRQSGLFENPVSADEYVEQWIFEESARFVRESGDRPFFLWCGFCGPHDPWDPPQPYRSLYDPADMPLPPEIPGWPSWRERWDEMTIRKMRAYYYGMITCIDARIGALVNGLRKAGLYDDALIVFTSDHGELMGERGRTGKGLFYESILRVPLIVKTPAGCVRVSDRMDGLVGNFSVAPTVLDYAGVPVPESMPAPSLRGCIEGRDPGRDAVFSEYIDNTKDTLSKCIRTADHKYIVSLSSAGRREELYDLLQDPLETENLMNTRPVPAAAEALKTQLFNWLALESSRPICRAE